MTAQEKLAPLAAKLHAALADEKQRVNLLVCTGLAGLVLLGVTAWLPAGNSTQSPQTVQTDTAADYATQLESRLTALIFRVEGAGKTAVMVTLESGSESIYATDKAVVCALEGYAINAGSALALSADFIVAGEGAFLQVGEVRQGRPAPMNLAWLSMRCASLWIDGELVHLEDLVLHDAGQDIRTPTHELTIARDVLRSRRRIADRPPGFRCGKGPKRQPEMTHKGPATVLDKRRCGALGAAARASRVRPAWREHCSRLPDGLA